MIYLVTGATGLVGSQILKLCEQKGIFVHYLTTRKSKIQETKFLKGFYWNPNTKEIDPLCLQGVTKIIHLSGATISKRWTTSYKKEIIDSRIASTELLLETLKGNSHSINQIIAASAIGIYPNSLTGFCNEENSEVTRDNFLAQVVQSWENSVDQFSDLDITISKIRTGLVLSARGGALPKMVKPIGMCLGAAFGEGKQWQSWIHITDIARIFLFVTENKLEGIYNGVAPNAVTQNKFIRTAAETIEKPLWMPNIPESVVKMIFGEMSLLLLSSQRVSSKKIKDQGFTFKYNTIESAMDNLLN